MLGKPGTVTISRGHINALDGVRGLAAAIVFIFHYGGGSRSGNSVIRILGEFVHLGWAGVSLFFALSGFLISGILWDSYSKPGWWKRFYIRRSLRIFPLYYLALFITIIVGLFLGIHLRDFSELWVLALYLGNMPIFAITPAMTPGIHLEHFWSLAVEEQFYVFWPWLLALFTSSRSNAKTVIAGLWLLSLIFRVAMLGRPHATEWQSLFLFSRAGELLSGAYLALMIRGDEGERNRLFRWVRPVMLASGFVLAAIVIYDQSPDLGMPWMATAGLCACSLFFTSTVASALRPGWIQSFFQARALRWLGKISYGIYVYHLLFHNGFVWLTNRIGAGLGPNGREVLLFFVAAIGTLIIASISFYTFESVFLRWKDRMNERSNDRTKHRASRQSTE